MIDRYLHVRRNWISIEVDWHRNELSLLVDFFKSLGSFRLYLIDFDVAGESGGGSIHLVANRRRTDAFPCSLKQKKFGGISDKEIGSVLFTERSRKNFGSFCFWCAFSVNSLCCAYRKLLFAKTEKLEETIV